MSTEADVFSNKTHENIPCAQNRKHEYQWTAPHCSCRLLVAFSVECLANKFNLLNALAFAKDVRMGGYLNKRVMDDI